MRLDFCFRRMTVINALNVGVRVSFEAIKWVRRF